MLPDRIAPFLERLDRFIETDPRAVAHVAAGCAAYLEGAGVPEIPEELREMAHGFAVYDWRDPQGRNVVDLYREMEEPTVSDEERRVWIDVAQAAFCAVEVVASNPGVGLTIRRLGHEEVVEINERTGSNTLKPGEMLCCRFVRYRDRHEFIEAYDVPVPVAYLVRGAIRRGGEEMTEHVLAMLEDPRHWLKVYAGRAKRAETLLDARLRLAAELPTLCPGVTMDEVERRIERMGRTLKSNDLFEGLPFPTIEALQRYMDLTTELYNWTPQDVLGGRCPEEIAQEGADRELREALGFDLAAESMARSEAWADLPEEEQGAARAALLQEWQTTPQEELGGQAPADVLSVPPPPPLPPESEWPPPDRPLWTRDQVLESLDAPFPGVREWALKKLERYDHDSAIERRVVAALADPDPEVRRRARWWITSRERVASADALIEALARDEAKESVPALFEAARRAPERAVVLIEEELAVVEDRTRELWLYEALGVARTPRSIELLETAGRDPSRFRRLVAAAGLYGAGPDSFLAATRILGSVCAEKRKYTKKAWKNFTKTCDKMWSPWVEILELLPVHWIAEELETFSPGTFSDLLERHQVREPRPFLELLELPEYEKIQDCWSQQSLDQPAVDLLAGLLTAALERSEGRDSAGYEELAGRVRALAAALGECSRELARLPAMVVRSFLDHTTAVLLKACHGRFLALEVEGLRGDAEALLDLNEVDLPFAITELADALAAHGAEKIGGDVIEWIGDGNEDFCTVRAVETIARLGRDPDLDREWAAAALGSLARSAWDYLDGPRDRANVAIGDPILRHLPVASEEKSDIAEWLYLNVASDIGTERALFAVRRLLPHLTAHVAPVEVTAALMALAHPSLLAVMEELLESMKQHPEILRKLETFRILCGAGDYSSG